MTRVSGQAQGMAIRFGSVCSGIESASVAWEPLGMVPAWFSEIEAFPCAVLAHHWPKVHNLGDMLKLSKLLATGTIRPPDVLVGGTPCQAYSVAGKRAGLADERGQLTLEYVKVLDEIDKQRATRGEQPAVCVWENVPGVLSSKDNAFGCFLGDLAGEDCELVPPGEKWTNAGYVLGPQRAIAWRILDAQYFGVAQRRKRVFVVASARDGFDPREVLFESDGVRRDTAPSREAGQDAAAGSGAGLARTLLAKHNASHAADVDTYVVDQQGWDAYQHHNWRESGTTGTLTANLSRGICGDSPLVTERRWPADIAATLNASFGDKQGLEDQHINGGASWFVPVAFSCKDNGRDSTPDLSPTMRAMSGLKANGGGQLAVAQGPTARRLTTTECERLQGFPDGHTRVPYRKKPAVVCPDGPRYKAIGNSKAVPVVRWVGERLLQEITK